MGLLLWKEYYQNKFLQEIILHVKVSSKYRLFWWNVLLVFSRLLYNNVYENRIKCMHIYDQAWQHTNFPCSFCHYNHLLYLCFKAFVMFVIYCKLHSYLNLLVNKIYTFYVFIQTCSTKLVRYSLCWHL